MAALMGDDGRGYELARRLEDLGVWRAWLGDAAYLTFAPALSSSATWNSFMDSTSSFPIQLQLRARALVFHKISSFAAACTSSSSPSPALRALSNINPAFLQLHADDIYISKEDELQEGLHQQPAQSRSALTDRCPENGNSSQKLRHDDSSENWYSQCIKKYRMIRYQKFSYGEKELHKRTSEGMSSYIKASELNKKRKVVFKDVGAGGPVWENGSSMRSSIGADPSNLLEEGSIFLPEIMFPSNCVPDSALPPTDRLDEKPQPEVYGVLDNLPDVISRSSAMMERFGIRPEHLKMGSKYRGKDGVGGNKKGLNQEQASVMTRKISACFLESVGFEGTSEVSIGLLSEFVSDHIFKLGQKLKLLSDSYRKQFSSIELLKMFLQVSGYSNLGMLVETTKDSSKRFPQQNQQQVRGLETPHQNPPMQAQQLQRHMLPQINMLHPQNLTLQQQQLQLPQWEKLRRRQATTPRGSTMDKDQPLMQVKVENITDTPMDGTLNSLNKHQLPLRQLQMALSSQQTQAGQQIKHLPSTQMPPLQTQNMYAMRMQPVKVEAFHELVSGDSSVKHEPDKLTSPRK